MSHMIWWAILYGNEINMFSIIIWLDLVVHRTRKTSFGRQTPFIGFNSAFTITISTWAVFGIIHLFHSCPTRANWQFGSCRMAIINIHKTLSHNKVHERTSSNEISQNDWNIEDSGVSEIIINVFIEELFLEETNANARGSLHIQCICCWIYYLCSWTE